MLKSLILKSGLTVTDDQLSKLDQFVNFFIEKNKVINLSKINDREEFLIKHIIDSLMIESFAGIESGMKVADLGTGGGLPGIPLSVMQPKAQFTLIDSVQKKIKCVEEFTDQLNLKNIVGLSERLELIGHSPLYREKFDVVMARALAPLPVLLELAIPLVKPGGKFIAMKGPGYLEEISDAGNAMQLFKLELPRAERYELLNNLGKRYLLIFEKKKPTPAKYPRAIGVPNKKPL